MNTSIRALEGRKVPSWVIPNLGCMVQLSKPFKTHTRAYNAGTKVLLISIQAGTKSPFATVVFQDDLSAEENIDFASIRPV
jgi:hypothetical protein